MAFFENIGKSITQAGQSAAKKTKDMTETVRINNAISDEEKRLAELQRKIGELYISLHAADYEKDFAGLMGEVQEVNGKIRDYQKQLQDIKGFVPCKNCGAAMPNGALFCSACGAAAPKPEQPTKQPAGVFCPNCGTQNDAGACFCQGCGKPVQQPEPCATARNRQSSRNRCKPQSRCNHPHLKKHCRCPNLRKRPPRYSSPSRSSSRSLSFCLNLSRNLFPSPKPRPTAAPAAAVRSRKGISSARDAA